MELCDSAKINAPVECIDQAEAEFLKSPLSSRARSIALQNQALCFEKRESGSISK